MIYENFLFESTLLVEHRQLYTEWVNVGKVIVEANLTIDQINQVFAAIGDPGDYRVKNILGKTASGINQAYQGIINAVSNAAPVKYFDQKFDNAMKKLKDATGGDEGLAQAVYWYRDFAKKYPVTQNVVYAGLIAAVGLATGGAAPVAALGAMKMVDRLLQGDKFSQAAIKGGLTAAAAAALRNVISHHQSGSQTQPVQNPNDAYTQPRGNLTQPIQNPNDAYTPGLSPDQQGDMLGRGLGTIHQVTAGDTRGIWGILQKMGIDPSDHWQEKLNAVIKANADKYPSLLKNPNLIKPGMNLVIPKTLMQDKWSDGYKPTGLKKLSEHIDKDATIAAWVLDESLKDANSVVIRESSLPLLWEAIEEAGFMDTLKGIGKGIAGGIEKIGGGIGSGIERGYRAISTNKLTTQGLQKAWGAGPGFSYTGRPKGADSAVVYKFLKDQGVDDETIKAAFAKLKIPSTGGSETTAPTSLPSTGAPSAPSAPSATSNQARVQAATKAQQQTQQGLNNYVRNVAAALNKAPPNQKFALTKELVNFMADRQNYPEWENAVQSVQSILKGAKLNPNFAAKAIQSVKSGQHMEAWQVNAINALLEAVGITWAQLGYTVLQENANSFFMFDAHVLTEAKNLAQQAAIAINMKKRGKKPKSKK